MHTKSEGSTGRTLGSCFLWGALWGMLAWQIYAVIEYAATTLVPLGLHGDRTIGPWHWKSSLILFAFYTLMGIVMGGLGGVLSGLSKRARPRIDHQYLRGIAAVTLVLAFLANQIATRPDPATILVCSLLILALAASLIADVERDVFRLLTNPWAIVLLLLALAYINYEVLTQSIGIRFAADAALLCVFAGVSHWTRFRFGKRERAGARWHAIGLAIAVALVVGCVAVLDRDIKYQIPPDDAPAAASAMPNIVLITMDTVRADHLSAYGYERRTTPNLDELANSATVFANAMAAGDMTLTSHSTIFTGTYASWNGARPNYKRLEPKPFSSGYPTLAEILTQNGYFTAGVGANSYYLSPSLGFGRGFQMYDMRTTVRIDPGRKSYLLRAGFRRMLNRFSCIADFDRVSSSAEDVNAVAFRLLDRMRGSRRPLFLFLNYMDAHEPYTLPGTYGTYFPGRDCSIQNDWGYFLQLGLSVLSGKVQMPEHARNAYISQYDGGIAYMDDQIGKLIQRLRLLGRYEDTLFIVTSDHGEAFGNHNVLGHGLSVYNDEVHVPLIVKYPRVSQHALLSDLVGHADILPTILSVAHIAPPRFLQGHAFEAQTGRDVGPNPISEAFPSLLDETHRAIYSDKFKFISSPGGGELYDLSSDDGEHHDVCSVQPERCAEMRQALKSWVSKAPRQPETTRELDSNSLERLKSLGYVQ